MKPDRPDIAIPPFSPDLEWVGEEPPVTERITARGPLLVFFLEAGELGSVRAAGLVDRLATHYRDHGLTTLGVHSPRNDLARQTPALASALDRLGIGFPCANDRRYRTWHAYGCKGWPSLFLWGRGGKLRWFHLGVEGIEQTEAAIRESLRGGAEGVELPEPVAEPLQPPAERLGPPSEEVFPSGTYERPWAGAPGEPLEVEYAGGSAWAALDGSGEVGLAVDGERREPLSVAAPGLYHLADHNAHGLHEVRLEPPEGVRVWSVAFGPGVR